MEHCTQELLDAYIPYNEVQFSKLSALDPVFYSKCYFALAHAKDSLCSPELLMNIESFPIGCSYGDRDYLGSEGADWVVKSNAFFKTGESQLFKLSNTGHSPCQGNPNEMVQLLTAFFKGEVRGVYEEKPVA